MVNGIDIYKELDAAYTAYLAKEYEDFGRDIGSATTLIFLGNSTITGADASRLHNMQQAYLYPSVSQGYNQADNKAFVDYLEYVSKSRSNPADDTLVKPDLSNVSEVVIPAHKEVEAAEVPTYMDGDAYYDARE